MCSNTIPDKKNLFGLDSQHQLLHSNSAGGLHQFDPMPSGSGSFNEDQFAVIPSFMGQTFQTGKTNSVKSNNESAGSWNDSIGTQKQVYDNCIDNSDGHETMIQKDSIDLQDLVSRADEIGKSLFIIFYILYKFYNKFDIYLFYIAQLIRTC